MSAAPHLEVVQLSYCKSFTDSALNHPIWSTLKSLNFQRCTGITDSGFQYWDQMIVPFALKEAILSDCSFLTDSAIGCIAKRSPLLTVLNLSFCCSLTSSFIHPLLDYCYNMECLDLSFCGGAVNDDCLKLIAQGFQKLDRLSIRGCVQVTMTGIEYLKSLPSLKIINVSQCKNVKLSPVEASLFGWVLITSGSFIITDKNPSLQVFQQR
jgi:F-box and leucine-rich repeat protein 7